ncbi:MAG: 7-cyano-7-deazaguanine synthase [Crocosphaera sp.]
MNYTLIFSPVRNSNGKVRFIDHSNNQEQYMDINVDDKEFQYRQTSEFPSVIADLIDLAVAISASDRLVKQPFDKHQCQIKVELPIRHPDLFNASSLQEKLENLMYWTTGSQWTFEFTKRPNKKRSFEQNKLPLEFSSEVKEVALWSGGLDALAGLYTRLCNNTKTSFILCGSGSNNKVYAHQKQTFTAINSLFPNCLTLYRIPIRFSNSKTHKKNDISRARGVVFTLMGVACAYLMGQKVLNIYENGIGAINLPYRSSALGLDHSRSVHPRTLLMVGELVSELLGESFKIQNPFLFWTKGQMCQALTTNDKIDLPSLTKSCDRPYHENPSQCGCCSSCLLRKQALAAAGIKDKTTYVVSHSNHSPKEPDLYFRNMLEQVKVFRDLLHISDNFTVQWEALTRKFPDLDDIVDDIIFTNQSVRSEIQKSFLQLYSTYVDEWQTVESQIKTTLTPKVNNQVVTSKSCVIVQQS